MENKIKGNFNTGKKKREKKEMRKKVNTGKR